MVVLLMHFIWHWLNPMTVVCFSQGTVAPFYTWIKFAII